MSWLAVVFGVVAAMLASTAVLLGADPVGVLAVSLVGALASMSAVLNFVNRRIERSRAVLVEIVGEDLYRKAEAVVAQQTSRPRRR